VRYNGRGEVLLKEEQANEQREMKLAPANEVEMHNKKYESNEAQKKKHGRNSKRKSREGIFGRDKDYQRKIGPKFGLKKRIRRQIRCELSAVGGSRLLLVVFFCIFYFLPVMFDVYRFILFLTPSPTLSYSLQRISNPENPDHRSHCRVEQKLVVKPMDRYLLWSRSSAFVHFL
jgi:hypothetical protein